LQSPIAIILHPDPSRGGTMNTKIVFKLYKIFVANGFSTIRFNFRGVGKSDGVYDNGEGELSDAASALDWLQQYNTNSKICWVVGFSFGAWVAMQLLMRRPEINGFVSVSPPANIRDFSFLAPCPSSGLIVHGDKDNVASFDSTKILAEKLQKQKKVDIKFKPIKGADHFYENFSNEFTEIIDNYIKKNIN
jgi:Predicted hydrolase of the alpha/beta superfamily